MIALLLPVLAAPFVGSFLGVLIVRLPVDLPVAMARSRCETCHRTLGPLDLVPLVSYAALRGRCRSCGAPIGVRHLAVEFAALGVALWAMTVDTEPAQLWIDCGLGWSLLALAWIDWRHLRLPDAITLPLLLAGLAATWLVAPEDTTDHAIGAVAGYLGFRLLARAYRILRGRDGLGPGDAKLLAAAGAWLGWMALPLVILLAAVCGIAVALVGTVRHGRFNATVWHGRFDGAAMLPFGPCLAFSIWVVRLYDLNGEWLFWSG